MTLKELQRRVQLRYRNILRGAERRRSIGAYKDTIAATARRIISEEYGGGAPKHGWRPPGVVVVDDDALPSGAVDGKHYRTINFRKGLVATDDGDRVDIDAAGGFGPFLYDILVDADFAAIVSAGTYSEGEEFTTFHGHTFFVYSTFQAGLEKAISAYNNDSLSSSIIVNAGSYNEQFDMASATGSLDIHIHGTGWDRTVIGKLSGPPAPHLLDDAGGAPVLHFYNLSLTAPAGSVLFSGTNGGMYFEHCHFLRPMAGSISGATFMDCDFGKGWVAQAGDSSTIDNITIIGGVLNGGASDIFDFETNSKGIKLWEVLGFALSSINAHFNFHTVGGSYFQLRHNSTSDYKELFTFNGDVSGMTIAVSGAFTVGQGESLIVAKTGTVIKALKLILTTSPATGHTSSTLIVEGQGTAIYRGCHFDISTEDSGSGQYFYQGNVASVFKAIAEYCKFTITPPQEIIYTLADSTGNIIDSGTPHASAVGYTIGPTHTHGDASEGGTVDHGDLDGLSDIADHAYAFLHDGSRAMTGAMDAGGYVINDVGDPVLGGDAVNLDTLLDSMGLALQYFMGGSSVMTPTFSAGENHIAEVITGTPQELTTIIQVASVANTPAPFTISAGEVATVHFDARVLSTSGKKPTFVYVQLGYVDADLSNWVQIGANSDPNPVALTASQAEQEQHIHFSADVTVPAGKRLKLKWYATTTGAEGNPTIWVYYGAVGDHMHIPVNASILGNYLPLAGGTMSGIIVMGGNKITGLAAPASSADALRQTATATEANLDTLTDTSNADALHVHDADVVTYTPAVATDWDSDADPGDTDDALDQLAERIDDVEGGALGDHDHTGDAGDGGTVDHGALDGLGDDDHTQYLLADGSRELSANWAPGAHDIGNFDYTAKPTELQVGDADFNLKVVSVNAVIEFESGATLAYNRSINSWAFTTPGGLLAGLTEGVGITIAPGLAMVVSTIDESSPTAGVTIDGLLIKDGKIDAGDATYTPAVATDWDGDADPGDTDDALDQLAERIDDVEGAAGHAESHTIASHNDTTGTGPELETLTDGSDADSLHTHPAHAAAGDPHTGYRLESADHSHASAGAEAGQIAGASALSDIGITDNKMVQVDGPGAGAPASGEYARWTASGVEGRQASEVRTDINVADGADVTGDNAPQAHAPESHTDQGATAAELETLTDGSDADALHGHPSVSGASFYVSLNLETPSASENFGNTFLYAACTVQEIKAVVVDDGGGSPSVTIEPVHHANRNTATGADNDILSSPTAITNEAAGQTLTNFDDPTIPADSWLWFRTTAVNNVKEVTVTLRLTWD